MEALWIFGIFVGIAILAVLIVVAAVSAIVGGTVDSIKDDEV